LQLTVSVAQPEDGGFFHCVLPQAQRNSIHVHVQGLNDISKKSVVDEKCPRITNSSNRLVFSTNKHFLYGSVVQFACHRGYRILGVSSLICLENGSWSHPIPVCQGNESDADDVMRSAALSCPAIVLQDTVLSVSVTSNKFGGVALFSCPVGFKLFGSESVQCTASGQWTDRVPVCQR
jgi:hypothetical protein